MTRKKRNQKPETSLAVRQPKMQRLAPVRRFDDLFGQSFLPSLWGRFPQEVTTWAPAIHVLEKDDRFVAKVELPGVHEEDVTVSVSGDTRSRRRATIIARRPMAASHNQWPYPQ